MLRITYIKKQSIKDYAIKIKGKKNRYMEYQGKIPFVIF
jgi:hypothetical protein